MWYELAYELLLDRNSTISKIIFGKECELRDKIIKIVPEEALFNMITNIMKTL